MPNSITVSLIEGRLPPVIKRDWSKKVNELNSEVDPFDKFPIFIKFLQEQRRISEYEMTSLRMLSIKEPAALINYGEEDSLHVKNSAGQRYPTLNKCIIHKSSNHLTEECRTFTSKEPFERIELLKELRACWSCLKMGHRMSDCRARKQCGINNCGLYHHQSLHTVREENCNTLSRQYMNGLQNVPNVCLLPLMKVRSINKELNVLWDSGASICLVTFKMASLLKLKGKEVELAVIKVGGEIEEIPSMLYSLPLMDKFNNITRIKAYGIEKISQDISEFSIDSITHRFKGLQWKDVQRPKGEVVGLNYASLHPIAEQSCGDLMVMNNRFGKCIAGSFDDTEMSDKLVIHTAEVSFITVSEDSFLEIEAMGIQCNLRCGKCGCGKCSLGSRGLSIKEKREQNLISEGLTYQDGYFMAHYPWVKSLCELPDNRIAALKRLESTESRLLKNAKMDLYKLLGVSRVYEVILNRYIRIAVHSLSPLINY